MVQQCPTQSGELQIWLPNWSMVLLRRNGQHLRCFCAASDSQGENAVPRWSVGVLSFRTSVLRRWPHHPLCMLRQPPDSARCARSKRLFQEKLMEAAELFAVFSAQGNRLKPLRWFYRVILHCSHCTTTQRGSAEREKVPLLALLCTLLCTLRTSRATVSLRKWAITSTFECQAFRAPVCNWHPGATEFFCAMQPILFVWNWVWYDIPNSQYIHMGDFGLDMVSIWFLWFLWYGIYIYIHILRFRLQRHLASRTSKP